MHTKTLFIFALILVGAFSHTLDAETKQVLAQIVNKLKNPSANATIELQKISANLEDLYYFDRCIEDARVLIEAHFSELGFLQEVLPQTVFSINKDCVPVANVVQYIFVELVRTLGIAPNATYVPITGQLINTTFEQPILRGVVTVAEDLNALYTCTVMNVKFVALYELFQAFKDYFHYTQSETIDFYHRLGLHFGYNFQQCAYSYQIIREALGKLFGNHQ